MQNVLKIMVKLSSGKCVRCSSTTPFDILKLILSLVIRYVLAIHSIYFGINSSYLIANNKENEVKTKRNGLLKILIIDYFQILRCYFDFPCF